MVYLQVLAKKMTVLYKLAREQLSKQSHYDFGLRALKSVLVMAGELKRGSPDLSEVLISLHYPPTHINELPSQIYSYFLLFFLFLLSLLLLGCCFNESS